MTDILERLRSWRKKMPANWYGNVDLDAAIAELEQVRSAAQRGDSTCYVERSKVREILIGQPDESLHITELVLRDIDALRIFTAADFAAIPPAPHAALRGILEKISGQSHAGAMLGGENAYTACLAIEALTAQAIGALQPEAPGPSDGAIYAAVSQRNMTPDERAGIEAALQASAGVLETLQPSGHCGQRGAPKVRTSHHRNKEEAARLQTLVNERYAATSRQMSDADWAKRHGIQCQHPDGGDQCNCQHYTDPKANPICRYARSPETSDDKTLWGQISAIYGELDAEDCAWIDREWARMRGYILPTNGTSTIFPDVERLQIGLDAIAGQIQSWLDWSAKHRRDHNPKLTTDDGTHIMSLPVPFWPTHGTFKNWLALFRECGLALSSRSSPGVTSEKQTPGARWREEGEPDPHGDRYDCERARLAGGHLTDDEVANAVFLDPGINNLTIAKDRIRWLSRKLANAVGRRP